MNALAPYKQISAILPDDEALMHGLIHALKEEKGLLTVNHYTCRGVGAIGKRSPGKRFRSPRQDEIFEFIFERAEMDKPMGGLLFVGPLDGATSFLMPDGIEDEA